MAEEKQTLLNVRINLTDTIKEMADYQQKIDAISIQMQKLTALFKNGDISVQQYNQEMVRLKETKKAYSKEMNELSRKTQNEIIAQQKYEGTLKGMCAQLSLAKDQLRAMKMTDPGWEEQRQYVDDLNKKIKEVEQSYGVYQRDVGHYRTEIEKTKEQIAETVAQMQELIRTHQQDSPEMQQAQEDLEKYNNTLASQGKNSLEAANNGMSALIGALGFLSMAFQDDSAESEKMQKLIKDLSVAMTVLSVITKAYDAAQKKGIVQKIAMNLQTKMAAKALAQEATAQAGSTAAKIAGTKAQIALNTAMMANPIGLIVAAVVALVAGLVALVAWLLKSTDAQKAANEAQKAYEEQVRKSENALAALESRESARAINISKAYQDEIAAMMKSGASKEQIDKKKIEMENALLDAEIASNKERQKIEAETAKKAEANFKAQQVLLQELVRRKGADAKATKEQQKVVDDAYKTYLSHINAMNQAIAAINENEFKKAETAYSSAQSAADKAYSRAQSRLSNLDKRYQEAYKRRYTFQYDYTKSAEENDAEKFRNSVMLEQALFLHQQKVAKDKLALDRKYGKITKAEYEEQLKVLESEYNTFALEQSEMLSEHTREMLNNAIKLAGGVMLDNQLEAIKSKYAAARKEIAESDKLSAEEIRFYTEQLAQQEAEEIKNTRLAARKKTDDMIKSSIDELYQYDIRQFSTDESEQISLEIEKLKRLIAERKKAGLNTLADEAALASAEARLRLAALNKDYQLAWQNRKAQYDMTKEYLEKEIALYAEGTAARAQLEQELAETISAHRQEITESLVDYANQTMSILSSMNDLANNLQDRELQKYEQTHNAEKKSLEAQLKAGLISQKQYDKKVADSDEELERKKAELDIKTAKRQKALGIMQAAINTAAAIMKIWAEVPKADFGVSTGILTALAAATGAMQIAAIAAEPLPTARIGGLVQGATHEQGGVLVNTEGGERIISRNPSAAFPELLNLISYIGKHSSIPDTGYASAILGSGSTKRDVDGTPIDYDILADKIGARISNALQENPPRIAIDEYERARKNYAKIEDSSKM